ncbi:MAG: hypothetical protein IKG70_07970 [Lachnospiraceae bacterium]|nr:hypothetical protein [Lachnospiraceae bacterium]
MRDRKFRIHLNIGTIIFGALLLYLLITFILFITHRHIETYQVITGPLAGNDTYTALILRDEDVVTSATSGYINHFISNGSKAGKRQLVCAVTSSLVPNEYKKLSAAEYERLRTILSRSSRSFDPVRFDSVGDLKFDILGALWDQESVSSASGNFYNSPTDGYIAYSTDDYIDLSEEEITPEMFRTSLYSVPKISNLSIVSAGDILYRIIYGEEWSIYFPITDKQLVRLAQKSDMQIRFLKDGTVEDGKLSFFEIDGQRYAKITLTSGMYRYIDDRYADIELFTNSETGLKIPVSSVVKKDFYAVPEEFIYNATGNGESGVYREVYYSDGSKSTEFKEITLYAEFTDEETESKEYYVDPSELSAGDVLVSPITNAKYTVNKTGTLEGVYCVNKGYAVFRKINLIDQNEENCIVELNTSYGIAPYDYIVKNGKSVKESDIVY